MVLFGAVVLGILIGLVSGGSFAGFSQTRIRYLPLLIVTAIIQYAMLAGPLGRLDLTHRIGPYLYTATILVSLWVITRNLSIPGFRIILVGAALNAIAIVANGGFMPASEDALRRAGQYEHVRDSQERQGNEEVLYNHGVIADDDTRFAFLGDNYAIPEKYPLRTVVSIGDVILAAGVTIAIVKVMHTTLEEKSEDQEQPADSPTDFS